MVPVVLLAAEDCILGDNRLFEPEIATSHEAAAAGLVTGGSKRGEEPRDHGCDDGWNLRNE